jgi:hypothetical protein
VSERVREQASKRKKGSKQIKKRERERGDGDSLDRNESTSWL